MQLTTIFDWIWRSSAQASVLVVLVLVAQFLFRQRLSARWRYALWLLPVLRLMLPWSPESSLSLFNAFEKTTGTAGISAFQELPVVTGGSPAMPDSIESALPAVVAEPVPVVHPHILQFLFQLPVLWLFGAAAFLILLMLQMARLRQVLSSAKPLEDAALLQLLEQCKAQMGVRRDLPVVETAAVRVPSLYGLLRPQLLLPEGMAHHLGSERLRHVFLHELAHLKRGDVLKNWLVLGLQVAHWFNPLLWYAFHRLRADRELACDEAVLEACDEQESSAYGETLIHVLSMSLKGRHVPGLVGINESGKLSRRRITMIAQFKRRSRLWSLLAAVVLMALAVVGLTNARSEEKQPKSKEGVNTYTENAGSTANSKEMIQEVERVFAQETGQEKPEAPQLIIEAFDVVPDPETGGENAMLSVKNVGKSEAPQVRVKFMLDLAGEKFEADHGVGPVAPWKVWNESHPFKLREGINGISAIFPESAADARSIHRMIEVRNGKRLREHLQKFDEDNKEVFRMILQEDEIKDFSSSARAVPTGPERPLAPAKMIESTEQDANSATVILSQGEKTKWRDLEVFAGQMIGTAPVIVTVLARMQKQPSSTVELGEFKSFVLGDYEITAMNIQWSEGQPYKMLLEMRYLGEDAPAASATQSDGKYTAAQLKNMDVKKLIEHIAQPEEGYHWFSAMWGLTDKHKSGDRATKDKIFQQVSAIIVNPEEPIARRWHSCYVMSGSGEKRAIPQMIQALREDPNETVRGVAACALGEFISEPEVRKSLEAVKEKEQSPEVLKWINDSLAKKSPQPVAE